MESILQKEKSKCNRRVLGLFLHCDTRNSMNKNRFEIFRERNYIAIGIFKYMCNCCINAQYLNFILSKLEFISIHHLTL